MAVKVRINYFRSQTEEPLLRKRHRKRSSPEEIRGREKLARQTQGYRAISKGIDTNIKKKMAK